MLTQIQWHKLDRDRTVAMIDSVKTSGDHILFSIATSEAKCAKLPFYKNLLLYRLTNYSSLPSFAFNYIGNGKTYHYLDGSTAPLYTANDSGHLVLSPQNILDYIIFFFNHVSGPDGDVFVIENPQDHPALDALDADQRDNIIASHQDAEISADGAGNYTALTTLFYMGSLVRATVHVDAKGRIAVSDYQMLLSPTSNAYYQGAPA